MPVVLSTAEGQPRSGYTYDDRTGVSYEYPTGRYEQLISTGEAFLYHRASKGYFGAGIIGTIRESSQPTRLVCEILDYQPFTISVPLKNPEGYYYEADQAPGSVYWAQGVRPISEAAYEEVVRVAGLGSAPAPDDKGAGPSGKGGYASGDVMAAVDEYAMNTAMAWAKGKYPEHSVTRMPHNNPGFDIRVGPTSEPAVFVEVKGTQTGEPSFFMSEGERKFSIAQAKRYVLLVISGVDIGAKSHGALTVREGPVEGAGFDLEPRQWRGRVLE